MKDENMIGDLMETEELKVEHDRTCKYQFKVSLDIDVKFIALIPAININIHSKTIEFEWLIFAIYIDL